MYVAVWKSVVYVVWLLIKFCRALFSLSLAHCAELPRLSTCQGYYIACEADYWYHGGLGCPNEAPDDTYWEHNGLITERSSRSTKMWYTKMPTDLSNNTGQETVGAQGVNGTYNRILFSNEAARLVRAHDVADPFFMYLAFMSAT